MKKAKSVLLILSAIYSFLTGIGIIIIAVFAMLLGNSEVNENNAANLNMTVEDLRNLLNLLKLIAIPLIIVALFIDIRNYSWE